jgi:hypothetical protein
LSWLRRAWPLTAGLLAAAYAWGLALGFVRPAGIAAIAPVFLLALLCGQTPDGTRGVALHGAFFALAVMLTLHRVPGFQNPLLLGPVAFTPDARPFTMHLNLDKAAVGFALLLLYTPLCRGAGLGRSLLVGIACAALAAALLLLRAAGARRARSRGAANPSIQCSAAIWSAGASRAAVAVTKSLAQAGAGPGRMRRPRSATATSVSAKPTSVAETTSAGSSA